MKNLPTGTVTFLFTDIEDVRFSVERLGAELYHRGEPWHRSAGQREDG